MFSPLSSSLPRYSLRGSGERTIMFPPHSNSLPPLFAARRWREDEFVFPLSLTLSPRCSLRGGGERRILFVFPRSRFGLVFLDAVRCAAVERGRFVCFPSLALRAIFLDAGRCAAGERGEFCFPLSLTLSPRYSLRCGGERTLFPHLSSSLPSLAQRCKYLRVN